MLELSRHDALFRQAIAEVTAWERTSGSFLTMNHQVNEVEHLPGPGIVPVVFGLITKVFVGHDDVMAVLLVFGQFVDGIAHAVGLYDEE
jgi:hypothetical protein